MQIDITVVTIGGAITSIGLGVNAYFFKQMVNNLVNVDKGLAVLIAKHERTEKDVKKNQEVTEDNCKNISRLKDKINEIKIIISKGNNHG